MRSVFGIFGKSPVSALERHAEKVHETVQQLQPLLEAFTAGDWEQTKEITKRIYKLEHQADQIRDEIRDHLPRSLFLPVDRGDVLLFLEEQDAIADRVEDVGDLLTMRKTPTPEGLRPHLVELVDQVVRTHETWYEAARELKTLQEASFGGPEASKVLELVSRVNHQEWEADKREAKALEALFTFEDELGAVSVLVWMNAIEMIGKVADHAETTADTIRLMIARA
jgi:predicted phosphate transport protein (TIGR00153 family)